jgi:hypothetical protein
MRLGAKAATAMEATEEVVVMVEQAEDSTSRPATSTIPATVTN